MAKVDYTVPGAIPPIYQSTYEHESQIEEGGLYSVTISDANKDGLYIDDGGSKWNCFIKLDSDISLYLR